MVGGVCINTGTIPSKTLREAVMYLTGMTQRPMYGESYRVKDDITIEDLFWRTQAVIQREADVVRDQLVAKPRPHRHRHAASSRSPHGDGRHGEDSERRRSRPRRS